VTNSLMRLMDVRRLAIEQTARVRFSAGGSCECTVDEHGVARIPTLTGAADFDLETEFAAATEFRMEFIPSGKASKQTPAVKRLTRTEVEQLCERKEPGAHVAAGQDHDE